MKLRCMWIVRKSSFERAVSHARTIGRLNKIAIAQASENSLGKKYDDHLRSAQRAPLTRDYMTQKIRYNKIEWKKQYDRARGATCKSWTLKLFLQFPVLRIQLFFFFQKSSGFLVNKLRFSFLEETSALRWKFNYKFSNN